MAELFPVLRDFIQTQLGEVPAQILAHTWQIMLLHHNFFVDTTQQCKDAWTGVGVPEGMIPWLDESRCEACSSSLLSPAQLSIDANYLVDRDEGKFEYTCVACGHTGLIAPLMIDALNEAHDYDPRDGEEPSVEVCMQCDRATYVIYEQICLWCAAQLDYSECAICEERLGQYDQDNGGLCSYHAHTYEKAMRD
ncbi:MAG: hypothetical protein ACOH2O_21535 [Pseudomonas sp.]